LIGGSDQYEWNAACRATRVGSDTALAQIVKLVRKPSARRRPTQLCDRAPSGRALALVGGTADIVAWLLPRAELQQAISSRSRGRNHVPRCSRLATPTAIMVGTGLERQARNPVQERAAIEAAARVQVVVMTRLER